MTLSHLTKLTLALLVAALLPGGGLANPKQGKVRRGEARIRSSGPELTVNQRSNRTLIEWDDFSIEEGETTLFVMPNASAVSVNRVVTDAPSVLLGTLRSQVGANGPVGGRLMLLNQNGILVGENSSIDAGSFVASTSRLAEEKELDSGAGPFDFEPDAGSGSVASFCTQGIPCVINRGTIRAVDAGLVALVAPHVRNEGVVMADLGRVEIAAGDRFTLDLFGDGLVEFALDPQTSEVLAEHLGEIESDGGTVKISAASATGVMEQVLNMEGVILARTVDLVNGMGAPVGSAQGQVLLSGGSGGSVSVAGSITGSGQVGDGARAPDAVRIESAGDLTLDADIFTNGGSVAVESVSGAVTMGDVPLAQQVDMRESAAIDTGDGAIGIQARGDVSVEHLISDGSVRLESMEGDVIARQDLVGDGPDMAEPDGIGSLEAIAAGEVSLHGVRTTGPLTTRAPHTRLMGQIDAGGPVRIGEGGGDATLGASIFTDGRDITFFGDVTLDPFSSRRPDGTLVGPTARDIKAPGDPVDDFFAFLAYGIETYRVTLSTGAENGDIQVMGQTTALGTTQPRPQPDFPPVIEEPLLWEAVQLDLDGGTGSIELAGGLVRAPRQPGGQEGPLYVNVPRASSVNIPGVALSQDAMGRFWHDLIEPSEPMRGFEINTPSGGQGDLDAALDDLAADPQNPLDLRPLLISDLANRTSAERIAITRHNPINPPIPSPGEQTGSQTAFGEFSSGGDASGVPGSPASNVGVPGGNTQTTSSEDGGTAKSDGAAMRQNEEQDPEESEVTESLAERGCRSDTPTSFAATPAEAAFGGNRTQDALSVDPFCGAYSVADVEGASDPRYAGNTFLRQDVWADAAQAGSQAPERLVERDFGQSDPPRADEPLTP